MNLAVFPHPLPRKTAYSPRSAAWTLYDPAELAAKLGLPVEQVDRALEQTGFNKAVRIREELIRWKENLRSEERSLLASLDTLRGEQRRIKARLAPVQEQLASVRNLLRLPREMPGSPVVTATRSPLASDSGLSND